MLATFLMGVAAVNLNLFQSPEQADVRAWAAAKFQGRAGRYDAAPPFSFDYGGKPFRGLVAQWAVKRSSGRIDAGRTRRVVVYSDPTTKLEVRCEAIEYADFPTVEWTVYLANRGTADTPIVSDLLGIDETFRPKPGAEFVLNHWNGSQAGPGDFEPRQTALSAGAHVRMGTSGGRPTQGDMPYFNLSGTDHGRIVAVGWPGQWAADFESDDSGAVHLRAGQESTRFTLHPGEQVRTPLIAMQFTDGSLEGAQNVWRRWFLAHVTPHFGGKPLPPQHVACSSHQFNEMLNANEACQKEFIDGYLANGLKLDYWWMDAGWYPNDGSWGFTGTWEPDKKRFPNGLRAVSDYGRKKGVKTIVWFEPERVHVGTWLEQNHPEWMLSSDGRRSGDQRLLNLGDPKALAWLTDHVSKLLFSEGIDFYRQDFNIDPLPFWRAADTADRQGMTEMRYVEGYLAYWDGLLKAHPGLPIDTCSSGGRRLDLETLRRSVPLLRSDYIFEPVGQQCHTYGLSSWVPYQGSGQIDTSPYMVRSVLLSSINTCWDVRRKDLDYALLRKLMQERRDVVDCLLGDYYPLTPYSTAGDKWIGWQFDLPSEGRGLVQAFRRADCLLDSIRLRLKALDPDIEYEVIDTDVPGATLHTGSDLMKDGLALTLAERPAAAVIEYKKVGKANHRKADSG
jgi:alpha-galactosidase